jgi:hypothetical protein
MTGAHNLQILGSSPEAYQSNRFVYHKRFFAFSVLLEESLHEISCAIMNLTIMHF